jgi:hypothetical protein
VRRPRKWPIAAVTLVILGSLFTGAGARADSPPTAESWNASSSGIGLSTESPHAHVGVLQNATYYDRALKSKLWVRTPGGMVFHSCAYNVPNGSYVDSINDKITLPDGTVRKLTACAYPRLTQPVKSPAVSGASAAQPRPAGTDGWMQGFQEDYLPPLGDLYVKYAVPSAPSQTSSSLTDIQWIAFASDPNGDSLLQPLLGWGYIGTIKNGVETSNSSGLHLEMAAYYYWSGNAVAASFESVNALDTIEITMQASGCSSNGGGCTWLEYMFDDNTGAESEFTVGSSPAYTSLIGMLESYNATNCNMLFANHHLVWRDLSVDKVVPPGGGTLITPSFYVDDVDQECSMKTADSSTGGDITWTP